MSRLGMTGFKNSALNGALALTFLAVVASGCGESDYEKEKDKTRWNPTPENQAIWEKTKTEMLKSELCGMLRDEIKRFDDSDYYCSSDFERLFNEATIILSLQSARFDYEGIPRKYRSFGSIDFSIEDLKCEDKTIVQQWRTDPRRRSC